MIPLRVLHVMGDDRGLADDAPRALIGWLARNGHAAALAVPATGSAPSIPGTEVITYGAGLVASLFGARSDAAKRMADWTPDIIHVHDVDALQAALDFARRVGLPVVVSVTGREDAHATRLLRDPRVAWVLIPTESHRAHYLGKVGLGRDRVSFLPPGIDVTAAGTIPYRTADGCTIVGFTGPCDHTSGIQGLVAALKQVEATHQVRGLYRPSSPADATRFIELVADLLPDRAIPLTDVGPSSSAEFTARIDVFADTGTDDHVSVPMLEAMACARPVLALAVGGMPELVRDGQTALLVPPNLPEALAAALIQLTDPERRRMLGEAGRVLAAERYDLALVGQAMVELYRVAIGGTRNSSAKAEGSTAYRRISDTRISRTV